LFAADKNLNKIQAKYFEIFKIRREESGVGEKTYDISTVPEEIIIFDESGEELAKINKSEITTKIKTIFDKIKNSSTNTFAIPVAQELMSDLLCKQIKAGNDRKADLHLMLYDRITPNTKDLGFSIKSMLGSASTLLNPSQATNFTYKLIGRVNNEKINTINTKSKIRDRVEEISNEGATLEFVDLENNEFKNNLVMTDLAFPKMIAESLKVFYSGKANNLKDVSDVLEKEGTLKKIGISKNAFDYKIKNFLVNIALGMTPTHEWDGYSQAYGGYIIVKEDGELVCYHLYNRDEFQDYLFENTKFDTPSSTRYRYGSVYDKNEESYIKLNLQIRFIK